MRSTRLVILAACAGLLGSCATTVPSELVRAREAYQRASDGPAAKAAPAELHVANQALYKAEQAFNNDPDSYQTRDLAYVAERKAQLAEATAAIVHEQDNQAQAESDYVQTQGNIVAMTKEDLNRTQSALAASVRTGETAAVKLSAEREARLSAEKVSDEDRLALAAAEKGANEDRLALAAAEKGADEDRLALAAADKQTAEARLALANLAAVKEEPRGIVITLSGSVLFASNQASLSPRAWGRLDQVADVLLTHRERNITIEGHTDSLGSDSSNLDLSQRRADAVRNYLVRKGYGASRVTALGIGEERPIADNDSAEGRANNRRVEITVEKDTRLSNN